MEHTEIKPTGFQKWAPLIVLSLALAIIIIDSTVLNVSISVLIKDLNTDIKSIQWVISIYSLVLAALTITGGRLGDLFGRKRMFVSGACLFAVGSVLASFSTNITTLLIGWSIIEGIGAALMMPATASLLVTTYHGKDRGVAFGVWGGIAAASAAIGPILGGFLTAHVSWNWAFRINVFIVLVLILGSRIIKESKDKVHKTRIDFGGVILSALGLMAVVYGIIESSTYGWLKAKKDYEILGGSYHLEGISISFITIILGILILFLFYKFEKREERKNRTPLVSFGIFNNKQFSSGILTMSLLALGQSGIIFAVPVFLQTVRGYDAFETGLALLPLSITIFICAPLTIRLANKVTAKRIIQIGLLTNFLAALVVYFTLTPTTTVWQLAPGLALFGAGFGFVMAQINNLILSAVEINTSGEASGINNTARQMGATLGSAVIGAVFLSTFSTTLVTDIFKSDKIDHEVASQIADTIETKSSDLQFSGAAILGSNLDEDTKKEIVTIANESTVEAAKEAMLYTGVFGLISLMASMALPNKKLTGHSKGSEEVVAGH